MGWVAYLKYDFVNCIPELNQNLEEGVEMLGVCTLSRPPNLRPIVLENMDFTNFISVAEMCLEP